MPDDTQTGAQAATGAQPQAGNAADSTNATTQTQQATVQGQIASADPNVKPQEGAATNAAGTSATDDKKPTLEEVLARLERAEKDLGDTRKEAASYRTKAKELDKLREEAENAKLDDVQKAQKRAEAAEAAMKTSQARIARAELKVAAKDAGIIDPDDAVAHLSAKIEFDDDGEPKNVADLVKALQASKPHLFAKPADPATQAAAQRAQQNAATASALGATNAQRAGGAVVVSADQYLDKAFQKSFATQHGMDIAAAIRAGKVTIV